MPTTRQDQDFAGVMSGEIDEVKISKTALDSAIAWIGDNLVPDDIFSERQLSSWAESNNYAKKE